MDAERQPLLRRELACCRHRPLTYEEVQQSRHEATWKRARFFLVLMFWAILAMFLSVVACILIKAPGCNTYDADFGPMPPIPPVHLSLAHFASTGRSTDNERPFEMSSVAGS